MSLAGYLMMVGALSGLILNHSVFAEEFGLIIVQGLAAALMIYSRITFGRRSFHAGANPTGGGLVTNGPYKYIRHPIYASILYFVWATVFSHLAGMNVLFAGISTLGVAIRIFAEERLIAREYPEYADYAARTKRVIPFLL
jgi:protein-S-isoprenylcysteine O-methyltransferase Ste14